MPVAGISVEYHNVLVGAIGATHGVERGEIERAALAVQEVVRRVENQRATSQHRYRDLPGDKAMLRSVESAVRRRMKGMESLVVLGIGGSALGNIALQTALNPPYYNLLPPARRGPRLFVLDNVDPVQFASLMDVLGPGLKKTLFNVISKSGETAETASQFMIVRDLLARKLGARAVPKNVLITTDAHSGTLRTQADAGGFETLPVPDGVGGRFTALSAVGLFSAAACGINIRKLLAGAAEMSRRVSEPNIGKNPAALLALLLHIYYVRGKRLHVMMPYAEQLKDLADWWRQLWAESLGKAVDLDGHPSGVGPTPIKALGATDQHSQVQLYREGPNDKVIIFLEVEKFARDVKIPRSAGTPDALKYLQGGSLGRLLSAEKRATEFALVASQRPCLTIRFPKITPEAVGEFIMLWEAATTLAGGLLNINPYDQPAVELGKQMTFALMGRKGYEAQAAEYKKFADGAAKARVKE